MEHEHGERIPLTLADFDPESGTITLVIQAVGKTTREMQRDLRVGSRLVALVGPMGIPSHIGKAKKVVDLFSGVGTFALRLARASSVLAVESDEKAVKSLDLAARNTQGLKPVSIERRDLFRRPLMVSELKTFDAVVFDPPRAGAEVQCAELARSQVKKVVAISCNPLTLARDLSILIAGGYRVDKVTPIDQFLWSPHVEAVATLSKG